MRAVMLRKTGPVRVLKIEDVPPPELAVGQVLIKIHTIGLNFADVLARQGYYPNAPTLPFIPGLEVCGVVDKTGEGVNDLKVGQRVAAIVRSGAYAEYIAVDSNSVIPIPEKMTFEEGAAFPINYLSAYHAIHTIAHLQPKEKILIHAAAGGVGLSAVQLARNQGAEIFGTVGNTGKFETVLSQGARHIINYTEDDFVNIIRELTSDYGVDVILDSVAGDVMHKSLKLLAPMGRYIICGASGLTTRGKLTRLHAGRQLLGMLMPAALTVMRNNISISGFLLTRLKKSHGLFLSYAEKMFEMYQQGKIKPIIGKLFHFNEIQDAHEYISGRHSIGKIVIKAVD